MSLADKPAFPSTMLVSKNGTYIDNFGEDGMTLRQYYAGLAMQGIIASCPSGMDATKIPFEDWAKSAVKQADALIKELEKKSV